MLLPWPCIPYSLMNDGAMFWTCSDMLLPWPCIPYSLMNDGAMFWACSDMLFNFFLPNS